MSFQARTFSVIKWIFFNYTPYFHDGSLININHDHHSIVLSMESAEISPDENKDKFTLSKHSTVKGKLHLEGVYLIMENEIQTSGQLKMLYDSAGILHFNIHNTTIKLELEWINFRPKSKPTAYSFYIIHAKKLWWENIPDLYDPFG